MSTATKKKRHKRLITFDPESGRFLSSSIIYDDLVGSVPGLRVLTREEDSRTMAWPQRFRYDLPEVVELRSCSLVVSSTTFEADGTQEVSVCIRDVEDESEKVKIAINGEEIELPVDDMVLISTEEPGVYVVQLIDPRFYSETPHHVITAIASGGSEN